MSPRWKAGSIDPDNTTTSGDEEFVTTERPFQIANALVITIAMVRTLLSCTRSVLRFIVFHCGLRGVAGGGLFALCGSKKHPSQTLLSLRLSFSRVKEKTHVKYRNGSVYASRSRDEK